MKHLFLIFFLLSVSNVVFGQKITSGEYSFGLKLAYDDKSRKLTGYFENYTGWDESTNSHAFSCIFYLQGLMSDDGIKINTFHPQFKSEDVIVGDFRIINNETIAIKLPTEHGGCWNVQHFADEPAMFKLEKKVDWVQIAYITTSKAFFYSGKSNTTKQKAYLVKNDFVCIDQLDEEWAHCTYYGNKISFGWVKVADLNKM